MNELFTTDNERYFEQGGPESRCQIIGRPVGNGLEGEAGHRSHFYVLRMPLSGQRHGRDKGHLVFRAAPGFAARELPTQVGIIDLNLTFERIGAVALAHRLHQLVLDEPGGRIADTDLAFQGQGGQSRLGLADQIDREKPNRQRQMSALKQRARDQRGLLAAAQALKALVGTALQDIGLRMTALRAAKALGPTGLLQGLLALCFGAELFEKGWQRQAGLEFNAIHRHDLILLGRLEY